MVLNQTHTAVFILCLSAIISSCMQNSHDSSRPQNLEFQTSSSQSSAPQIDPTEIAFQSTTESASMTFIPDSTNSAYSSGTLYAHLSEIPPDAITSRIIIQLNNQNNKYPNDWSGTYPFPSPCNADLSWDLNIDSLRKAEGIAKLHIPVPKESEWLSIELRIQNSYSEIFRYKSISIHRDQMVSSLVRQPIKHNQPEPNNIDLTTDHTEEERIVASSLVSFLIKGGKISRIDSSLENSMSRNHEIALLINPGPTETACSNLVNHKLHIISSKPINPERLHVVALGGSERETHQLFKWNLSNIQLSTSRLFSNLSLNSSTELRIVAFQLELDGEPISNRLYYQ